MADQTDASIPMGIRQMAPPPNPLTTLGQVMGLKRQQQEVQAGELENQDRVKKAAEDAATAEALRTAKDPDEAVRTLYNKGFGRAGMALSTQLATHRKSVAEAAKLDAENRDTDLRMRAQLLTHIIGDDAPPPADGTKAPNTTDDDERRFQAGKQAVAKTYGQSAADEMGDHYDKDHLRQLRAMGMSMADQLRERRDSATSLAKAHENDLKDTKDKAEIAALHRDAAGRVLSLATTDQQWQSIMLGLKHQGISQDVLDQFGSTYSPENVKKAKDLTMKPEERERLGFEKSNSDRYWQALRDKEEKPAPYADDPTLNPRVLAQYNAWVKTQPRPGTMSMDPTKPQGQRLVKAPTLPDIQTWYANTQGADKAPVVEGQTLEPPDGVAPKPPAGMPPAGAPAAPAAAAPAPVATTPTKPKAVLKPADPKALHLTLQDGRMLEFKTQTQMDEFLKRTGMSLKK